METRPGVLGASGSINQNSMEKKLAVAQLFKNSLHFMEAEMLVLFSQEPSTGA
jgi:hypothetical protein